MAKTSLCMSLALFFSLIVSPVHADCFCAPPVYSSTMSGVALTCEDLDRSFTESAIYFGDYYCSGMGSPGSCNVTSQHGECTPTASGHYSANGTFSYRCLSCSTTPFGNP
jgi:hypothetical protein